MKVMKVLELRFGLGLGVSDPSKLRLVRYS
jgi:hypothetical protein